MLKMVLNLPTGTVSYNKVGKLVSAPIPYTPEKIKATNLDLEVTGYTADSMFLAFDITSPDKLFSLSDKYTLLRNLGFKTVPVSRVPSGNDGEVNALINLLLQYREFEPIWWSVEDNCKYELPELRTVTSISWGIDAVGRLVKVLETNNGTYRVIDHRAPEYYQPGSTIKVSGDKVMPYQSSAIIEHTPAFCPVCNNPLARMQVSTDTPLIFKCKSPVCRKLRVTDDPVPAPVIPEDETEPSFRESVDTEPAANPLGGFEVTLKVVNFDVDLEKTRLKNLVEVIDPDTATAETCQYVLTRSRRSVSKRARKFAESSKIPMISVEELEEKLLN